MVEISMGQIREEYQRMAISLIARMRDKNNIFRLTDGMILLYNMNIDRQDIISALQVFENILDRLRNECRDNLRKYLAYTYSIIGEIELARRYE